MILCDAADNDTLISYAVNNVFDHDVYHNGAIYTQSVASIDSTYTVADSILLVIADTGAGQDTVFLPAAASNTGRLLDVKFVNANGGHIDGNASETIDGAAVVDASQYGGYRLYCTGSAWLILASI